MPDVADPSDQPNPPMPPTAYPGAATPGYMSPPYPPAAVPSPPVYPPAAYQPPPESPWAAQNGYPGVPPQTAWTPQGGSYQPYLPAYGYPAPPPPPRRSRAGLIVTIVAVVVVLACFGFGTLSYFALRHSDDSVLGSPPRATLPTDDPTDDPEPGHVGPIKQYVMVRPITAHAWPKVKAEEPLDLAAAADGLANSDDTKVLLQSQGFKDGYIRRWMNAQGAYIFVRVLRFNSASGADNFASTYIDSNQSGGWGDPQDVPDLPDAAGFVKPTKEKNGFQRSLAVGVSTDIVAMVVADQVPPARAKVPDDLLTQEFHLL